MWIVVIVDLHRLIIISAFPIASNENFLSYEEEEEKDQKGINEPFVSTFVQIFLALIILSRNFSID